jgi:adenine-specific DNA-methyltransferase
MAQHAPVSASDIELYSVATLRGIANRSELDGATWATVEEAMQANLAQLSQTDALPGIASYRAAPRRLPFALFTLLYADTYFDAAQCRELDSIRYAIWAIRRTNQPFAQTALSAMLITMSRVAQTTGHFAHYLDTAHRRWRSPFAVFRAVLGEFAATPPPPNPIRTSRVDAISAIRRCPRGSVSLAYLDPPYTKDQYSRFYHLLTTAVKYDYPVVTGQSRYRLDRTSSAFSRMRSVVRALDTVVAESRDLGATIALSYSSHGLLPLSDLQDLVTKHYRDCSTYSLPVAHSTSGSVSGHPSGFVTRQEHLVLGHRPRS